MRIVIDENITGAFDVFSEFGDVLAVHGRKITREMLLDAHALIVRSVTKVNRELLEGTRVRFVGTATIGRDHIDESYLAGNGIKFADAKGCNANAVKEYIVSALIQIAVKHTLNLNGLKMGIIGAGDIGSRVASAAELFGISVVLNDPPLFRKTGNIIFKPISELFDVDILTIHTPLIETGIDRTRHLINRSLLENFSKLKVFLNASRGETAETSALIRLFREKGVIGVLDVWENEPNINGELLNLVHYASPHVAGYSLEGKINGTIMMYNALCHHLKIKPRNLNLMPKVEQPQLSITHSSNTSAIEKLHNAIKQIYSIEEDTKLLKSVIMDKSGDIGAGFDELRKNYRLRREFANYSVSADKLSDTEKELFHNLGFTII